WHLPGPDGFQQFPALGKMILPESTPRVEQVETDIGCVSLDDADGTGACLGGGVDGGPHGEPRHDGYERAGHGRGPGPVWAPVALPAADDQLCEAETGDQHEQADQRGPTEGGEGTERHAGLAARDFSPGT